MSYNDRLEQTGRKVASARRKYYGSFDYGSGLSARQRGGSFSFGKKFELGGEEDWIDEPDVQALIEKYFRKHPNDAWKFNKNLETGQDYGAEFEGSGFSGKTNWGGLATLGLGMLGEGVQSYKSMDDKSKAIQQKYDAFGTDAFSGITDNSSFLNRMSNTAFLSGATAKDFRNKTVGQDIMSALSTGVNATISSGGNYWVGLGAMALDAGKSVLERFNAKEKAREATLEAKRKNLQFLKDSSVAALDVDSRNDWMRMYGYYNDPFEYAFGGPLHSNGGDYNGGLTYIDEGGRHEDNPLEGVPSGFDGQGNQNLVEEGEVIWDNDYVFSDRLEVPEDLAKKYKLGGKKYTFADAIAKLTKENNISPNDSITIATTKDIVNEFMDAQEAIRAQKQLAAKEELEAARADDFLAQLDAIGVAPQGMNLPPIMGMPSEAPVTEGEMMPPGAAFGGRKFEEGGSKDDYVVVKVGNKYFITTEGAPKITGKMSGNQLILDKQFRNLQPFNSADAAKAEIEKMRRVALPALEYQADIQASGIVAETSDKIHKRQTGYNTKGEPIYQYVVVDPNNGKKHYYSSYEDAAKKYSSIPRKVNGVQGGYAYVTPYGDVHKSEKGAKEALNTRLHPQSTSTSTQKGNTTKGIGTTAMAATVPQRVEVQTTATQPTATTPTSTSGAKPSSKAPAGNYATIPHNKSINGKEWEAAEPYQNFLSYMRGKGKDSPEAKEWMDYIQNEIKNSGSSYTLKDFDDWSRLAEDGKVGPVHQATLKAAEYYAKRQGLKPVDTTSPIKTPGATSDTIAAILGDPLAPKSVTPQGTVDVTEEAPTSESPFKYRSTWQRQAPVIGSAMAALYGMLNSPDYSNADAIIEASRRMGRPINIPVETIGDYRKRNPFDERYLVNMANQNRVAGVRSLQNTSGGNRSMDLLGAMSLAHNNQIDLGEIMRQAYLANRADDAQVAEFNRGTNIHNMNAVNQRNMTQAQLNTHREQAGLSGLSHGYGLRQNIKDSWDSATMESLNSMLASLGAIGKENEEYNILTSMAEQGYYPYYYGDRSIMKYNPYTGEKISAKIGGKLNRKKRRF